MQFVVFMDLVGTVVLPVAICLTYSLVVNMILNPPNTFNEAIPLMLLLAVIGLPGVLILITTRKVVYIFWMLIYLLALPIWNFILPVYAFWHFDDFSWGQTRYVLYAPEADHCFSCLSIEKSKAKARILVTMVPLKAHIMLFPCVDGKTGSVHVYGRSNARKSEGEIWPAFSPTDSVPLIP